MHDRVCPPGRMRFVRVDVMRGGTRQPVTELQVGDPAVVLDPALASDEPAGVHFGGDTRRLLISPPPRRDAARDRPLGSAVLPLLRG